MMTMKSAALLLGMLLFSGAALAQDGADSAQPAVAPAEAAPAAQLPAVAGASKAKRSKKAKGAKKKAKKAYDYEASKYKAIVPKEPTAYRYDAEGNPILPQAKKKAVPKNRSEAAEPAPEASGDAACTSESCK